MMKKHIPNLITCLNATSGMAGVLFAFNGELFPAAVCVLAAMATGAEAQDTEQGAPEDPWEALKAKFGPKF